VKYELDTDDHESVDVIRRFLVNRAHRLEAMGHKMTNVQIALLSAFSQNDLAEFLKNNPKRPSYER
jgi:hypothetical protein